MKKPVLLAVAAEALDTLTPILEPDFAVTVSTTLTDAREKLRRARAELILCGLYFDESRMFDLLRYVKADPATSSIPFFCINPTAHALPPTLLQSVEIASKALGARDFIDFPAWESQLGSDAAERQLRACLQMALPQPSP